MEMKHENKKIHLTVTSPPYFNVKDYVKYTDYNEYLNTLKNVFSLVLDITEDGRMCCVNISNILIPRKLFELKNKVESLSLLSKMR